MKVRTMWQRLLHGARTLLRESFGQADYERYLRRCAQTDQPPLDPGRYLAQRWE